MNTLRRTFEATFLNQVVNHESVRPWVGGDRSARLDLTSVVEDHANVALINRHGGFVFVQKEPHVYEVHTQFLPAGRGESLRYACEAARYMFGVIGAERLVTDVPDDNRPALNLAIAVGFVPCGSREDDGATSGKPQKIRELEFDRASFFKASKRWDGVKISDRLEGVRVCL